MVNKIDENMTKSLRIVDPKLYHYIVNKLNDTYNIHSYDVEIVAMTGITGLKIKIRYGEDYKQSKEAFFSFTSLQNHEDDFTIFIDEVAKVCKKAMVADYFKMMKP